MVICAVCFLADLNSFTSPFIRGADFFGYHLSNVILHAGVSCLVFILVFNLLASLPIAAATAVFFAVSFLNTEAVVYIFGRAEMLMGFFAILCLLLFIRSQKSGVKNPILFYILSVASFILALLSKEAAITLPFIICGYIFYLFPEKFKEKYYFIKKTVPFFAVSLIYPGLRFLRVDLHKSGQLARGDSYAGILSGIICLGLIIISCAYSLKYSSKNKVGSFMFFWALVFFIPQSGAFPVNTFIAEHSVYLSSVSFFMLLAYVLHKVLRRQLFILAVAGFSVFFVLLSSGGNFEWANPVVFTKISPSILPGVFRRTIILDCNMSLGGSMSKR